MGDLHAEKKIVKDKIHRLLFPIIFCSTFLISIAFPISVSYAAAPAAPSILAATAASPSQINLSWKDNSTNETGFSLERATATGGPYSVIKTLGANVTTYSDTKLTQTTTYYYRVRAYSGTTYSKYSNVVSATTLTLSPPTNLTAAVTSPTQINLSWTDNTTYETRYDIERGTSSSGPFSALNSVGANVTTYQDTSAAKDTTYYYRVRAYDGTNFSAYSNVANATIITITASAGPGGTISPVGTLLVTKGANQTFTITPNTGYRVGDVKVDGTSVGAVTTYTFTNVTASHTIAATFASTTFTITATANPNGTITPTGAVVVNQGLNQTFTITPNAGYSITDVVVDTTQHQGAVATYTFTNVTTSHTITASFADVTPPLGSVAINNGAVLTNNPAVTLTVSATDSGSGVSQMQFSNDNTTWSAPETYATTKSWTLAAGDGTKTVYVKFKDNANNWSNAIPGNNTITLDTTPPTVTITSPAAGFTNNKTPLLSYSVSDGTVAVKVDGVVVSKVSGNNLDVLTDGQHTVRVESTDAANNTGYAEVNFTVDTIAPAVTITSPAAGFTNNKTPLLNYTSSDGSVVVKVDGVVVSKVSGNNLDALPDGPHTVRVESTDAANNTGLAEVNFTVDTTAPIVSITSPASVFTNTNAPLLSYTVSDGTVVVKVDGAVVSKVSGNNLDALTDGPHTVRVESTDAANNIGYAEVNITVDTVAPVVAITSPTAGFTNNKTPLLNYTVSDGTVVVKVDGVIVPKVAGNNLDALVDGAHTVRVESTDAATNMGYAEVDITVDATPPVININPVTTPTTTNSQTITGSMETGAIVTLAVSTTAAFGPVSYPTATTWSCTLSSLVAGSNNITVTATDPIGNNAIATASITLTASLVISNTNSSRNTIDTSASETASIFFTLNAGPATSTLKIFPEKQGPTGTPVYQATQICSSSGAYSFSWDGKDSVGKIVPDEAYLYILTATDGVRTATYSPTQPTGTGTVSCTTAAGYDPYNNTPLTVSYTLPQPARINISVLLGVDTIKILDAVPRASSNYTADWDGRNPSGTIIPLIIHMGCAVSSLIRENYIIATGDTPKITQLKTDPYEIHLSYGQTTKIKYVLSIDANVTVKLISPTGAAFTLINNQPQAAGAHTLLDDNTPVNLFDMTDTTGKKFLVSEEGNYTVSIQAVNTSSGSSSIAKGNLRVGY